MKELDRALQVLKTLSPKDSKEDYIIKAKESFDICNGCLEAVMLLNCFEKDNKVKISNLESCLFYIEKSADKRLKNNIPQLIDEISDLYIENGDYSKALALLEKGKDIETRYKKMSLYAYLNVEEIEGYYHELIVNAIDSGYIGLALPYAIYLYRNKRQEEAVNIIKKICDINEDILDVLTGKKDINSPMSDSLSFALEILKANRFLINSSPGFIEYMVSVC